MTEGKVIRPKQVSLGSQFHPNLHSGLMLSFPGTDLPTIEICQDCAVGIGVDMLRIVSMVKTIDALVADMVKAGSVRGEEQMERMWFSLLKTVMDGTGGTMVGMDIRQHPGMDDA